MVKIESDGDYVIKIKNKEVFRTNSFDEFVEFLTALYTELHEINNMIKLGGELN